MRDLPGLYWNQAKNRYFPLSSRVANPLPATLLEPAYRVLDVNRTRLVGPYRSFRHFESARRTSQISQIQHQILCSDLTETSNDTTHIRSFPNTISAFSTMLLPDGRTETIVGDNRGWLYIDAAQQQPSPEFRLPTTISSISSSRHVCVATTFGSPCKVVVYNAITAETFILSPGAKLVYDVWTSHFRDRSLALGMHNKGIFLPDINVSHGFEVLDTYSDVLAIHQQSNLVYTGTRSGVLSRWDIRTATADETPLLSEKYAKKSIVHVHALDDWRLIVSSINGEMDMYDLRFPVQSKPILSFSGHVNTYCQKLAFAVDPLSEFLFVAGQDHRIRSWSLRTGILLTPHAEEIFHKLFKTKFEEPISSMQVTNEREHLSISISSGPRLQKYHLFSQ